MRALLIACTALALPAAAPGQSACDAVRVPAVLQQMNALRAQGGLCGSRGGQAPAAEVQWSPQLLGIALEQARWMADHGRLIHTGREGQTLPQRATEGGYRYARIVENLAHGQRTVAQALDGWAASESHCVNLYDSAVTEMALACVPGRDGRAFWALLMARPL